MIWRDTRAIRDWGPLTDPRRCRHADSGPTPELFLVLRKQTVRAVASSQDKPHAEAGYMIMEI